MKKFVLATLVVFGFSSFAMADNDFGLEVGIRQQSGDLESGGSTNSQNAFQFGGFAHFPVYEKLHFRTGMLYTQRPIETEVGANSNKITMNYLDVPVALLYKFEEYAGFYGGISLGLNLDAKADSGADPDDVVSPLVPLIFGAFFKFHPDFGVNIYYESASGKVADGFENYRAVGANLMITFD